MLFLLAILAGMWENITTFAQPDALLNFNKKIMEPGVHNFERQMKSMVGLDHTNVRAPYGGNTDFIKQLTDPKFFSHNTKYNQAYQKNLRNVQVDTSDWRLFEQGYISQRNAFGSYSLREASFQKINDFWKLRRKQENQVLDG